MSNKQKNSVTMQIAKDRIGQQQTPIPTEIARFDEIQNVPSLIAQKVLQFMIHKAENKLGDYVEHTFILKDLNAKSGVEHFTRSSIKRCFSELIKMIIISNVGNNYFMGGVLDYAHTDDTRSGEIIVTYGFGTKFRKMANMSQQYAFIDQISVYKFHNVPSMLLYQHLVSLINVKGKSHKTFSLEEIKRICGITPDKYPRMAQFKERILEPIKKDFDNNVKQFKISYEYIKTKRAITHVRVFWKRPEVKHVPPTTKVLFATEIKHTTNEVFKPRQPLTFYPLLSHAENHLPWKQHFQKHHGLINYNKFRNEFQKWLTKEDIPNTHPDIFKHAEHFFEILYSNTK